MLGHWDFGQQGRKKKKNKKEKKKKKEKEKQSLTWPPLAPRRVPWLGRLPQGRL